MRSNKDQNVHLSLKEDAREAERIKSDLSHLRREIE